MHVFSTSRTSPSALLGVGRGGLGSVGQRRKKTFKSCEAKEDGLCRNYPLYRRTKSASDA